MNIPPGLPVGKVTQVLKQSYGLYQYAKVVPAVPLERLEEVLVVRVHPEYLKSQKLPEKLVTKRIWDERLDDIRRHRVVIAVAGMEGALFSVLGGLVAAPVIAVTGTNGKSTTTTLLHEILKAAGRKTRLAGNILHRPLSVKQRQQPPPAACSLARTVWHCGHQLTQLFFRKANPFSSIFRKIHWFHL